MTNIQYVTKPTAKAQAAEAALRRLLTGRNLALPTPVVIAIGGDGTLLKAIMDFETEDVLFVGVAAGHLGFLQTISTGHLEALADSLERQTYSWITAPLLAAREVSRSRPLGHAFNDIIVERAGSHAARFDLKIDQARDTFVGDGVIFATPLGSTAYSLAAGGPIIDSRAQDLCVVTPNNPHISSLYSSLQRPHVLTRQRRVTITVAPEDAAERPLQLTVDGRVVLAAVTKPVEVYVSRRSVKLLQLEDGGFHSRIDERRLGRS